MSYNCNCGQPIQDCTCIQEEVTYVCPDPEVCEDIQNAACVAYTGSDLTCASSTLHPDIEDLAYLVKTSDPLEKKRLDSILSRLNTMLCYFMSKEYIANMLSIITNDSGLNAAFCNLTCSCNCNTIPPEACTCNIPTNLTATMSATGSVATAVLNWTPGGGVNSHVQGIRYKLHTDSSWIYVGYPPTTLSNIGTINISSLLTNRLYDFQVINFCSLDYTCYSASATTTSAAIVCPGNFTLAHNSTDITVHFSNGVGDITGYTLKIKQGSTLIDTHVLSAPFSSTVSDTFTSLTPSTAYTITVDVFIGSTVLTCTLGTVTTDATTITCEPLAQGTTVATIPIP